MIYEIFSNEFIKLATSKELREAAKIERFAREAAAVNIGNQYNLSNSEIDNLLRTEFNLKRPSTANYNTKSLTFNLGPDNDNMYDFNAVRKPSPLENINTRMQQLHKNRNTAYSARKQEIENLKKQFMETSDDITKQRIKNEAKRINTAPLDYKIITKPEKYDSLENRLLEKKINKMVERISENSPIFLGNTSTNMPNNPALNNPALNNSVIKKPFFTKGRIATGLLGAGLLGAGGYAYSKYKNKKNLTTINHENVA